MPNKPIDCFLVGFNPGETEEYIKTVALGGKSQAAYRDLALSFVQLGGKPRNAMEILESHSGLSTPTGLPLSNGDFLWPVIIALGNALNRAGLSFDFVNRYQEEKDRLGIALRAGAVKLVAITTTVYISPQPILEIVQFVRSIDPNVPIVVGGPYVYQAHVGLNDTAFLSSMADLGADFAVVSMEGERTLVELTRTLKAGDVAPALDNLVHLQKCPLQMPSIKPEGNALEANVPDYDLFERENIGQFVSLRTAKSCPFNCAFCAYPDMAGRYEYMSVDAVQHELSRIRDFGGVTTLTFIDDTFNVPLKRFHQILEMMIKEDFGFRWNSYFRSDFANEETVELMARSGCEGVFLGMESGADEMLERMKKKSRQRDYSNVLRWCREAGILTYASLIIGFPGETRRTVETTREFLKSECPDFFRAQCWWANPITPVFRQHGDEIKGQGFSWSHSTMNSSEAAEIVEDFFLDIDDPVWVPQWGFEFWSVFYLRRLGMSVVEIKDYLGAFNACVRAKLLDGEGAGLSPQLSERLLQASRRQGGTVPKVDPTLQEETFPEFQFDA